MDAPLLTDDFREFLRLLNANRVDYLLVGGFAVGLHGYPRATVDLDIWVAPTTENARRVIDTLVSFGFAEAARLEAVHRPTKPGAVRRTAVSNRGDDVNRRREL